MFIGCSLSVLGGGHGKAGAPLGNGRDGKATRRADANGKQGGIKVKHDDECASLFPLHDFMMMSVCDGGGN